MNSNNTEKILLEYERHIPDERATVLLRKTSRYAAERAAWAASYRDASLGISLFSYSAVGEGHAVDGAADPITRCAEMTGVAREQQLKSVLLSDDQLDGKHTPHAAVAILPYNQEADCTKITEEMIRHYRDPINPKRLHVADTESLGIVSGFLGVNPETLSVPMWFTSPKGEFEPYTTLKGTMYLVDSSLRDAPAFCMLAGEGKADALVVVSGHGEQLGNQLDAFFRNYFGGSPFVIADIKAS